MDVGSTRPRDEDIKGRIRVLRRAIGERDREAFPAMSPGGGDAGVYILANVYGKADTLSLGVSRVNFKPMTRNNGL